MATASSEPAGGACSPTVERFLRYMTAEKAASPLTIKSYREDLLQLEEFLQSAGCRTPAEATSPLLRRFAAGLHAAGYAPATVARKLASLRSLYAFGQREGWVRANPAKPLRSPRRARKLPRFLTGEEIARLLAAPQRIADGFLNGIPAEGQGHGLGQHLEAGHGFVYRPFAALQLQRVAQAA